jgi:hypothetical protein
MVGILLIDFSILYSNLYQIAAKLETQTLESTLFGPKSNPSDQLFLLSTKKHLKQRKLWARFVLEFPSYTIFKGV